MEKIFLIDNKIEFSVSEKKLTRVHDGIFVKLRAPAAFCLELLIENQGKLVTYDFLYEHCWGRFGMTASSNVLHNTIFFVRKSLLTIGSFDPRVIENISRRGFVFSSAIVVSRRELPDEYVSEEDILVSQEVKFSSDPKIELNDIESKVEYNQPNLANKYDSSRYDYFISKLKFSKFFIKNVSFLLPIALSVLLCSIMMLLFSYLIGERFPYSYTSVGALDKCEVFQNNLSYQFQKMKFVDDIKNFCTEKSFLYVTSYLYTNRVSAIRCTRKVNLFSADECISNFYTYKNIDEVYK